MHPPLVATARLASCHPVLPCLALALALAATARPQDVEPPAPPPAAATRLELRAEPVVDLLHWVRHLAGPRAAPPVPEPAGLAPAIEAARAVQTELGSPLAWGALEGLLPGCKGAADVRARWSELPETLNVAGRTARLREPALALADALGALEAAFLEQVWPQHLTAVDAARSRLDATLVARQGEALGLLLHDLAMPDPAVVVPVYLVAEGPFPGAVTHRDDQGRGVCFVAVAGNAEGDLLEIILHEATHALDVATAADDTALQLLRARLAAAGLAEDDRAAHDAWHALMFVQAGETVRAVFDPAHVDYAEARGLYERLGKVGPAVRDAWRAARRGELTRDEAFARIVEAAKG